MTEHEEYVLLRQLEADEAKRDRNKFDYTIDALLETAITPLAIWPESNKNVRDVVEGGVDYNSLPYDEENEIHKGACATEQQDIILRNWPDKPLCEAREMKPCLREKCVLYDSSLGPPVCREFKMAFTKDD